MRTSRTGARAGPAGARARAAAAAPAPEEGQPAPSDEQMAATAKDHIKRIDEEYTKAVDRYTQSLAIKPDFYEATIAWGQQCFERAKIYHFAAKAGDAAAAHSCGEHALAHPAGVLRCKGAVHAGSEADERGGGSAGVFETTRRSRKAHDRCLRRR